ncbi:hypothetical protein [Azospirillum rugosum]|uniref:Uncharacterized protein n=1 Tax=Azospirillum rugosum TaxID=416170 RepID=A0ABS4SR35_9PROT|nr:hypothetical protein [Azospirillum rugosum]MBP2295031.1 hypothetical protein [Azospirillum rugosum]MDQ0528854.1 hypothetical protein [Azospirillum rugosum]
MDNPKYHVGQIVYFAATAVEHGAPSGAHRIERLLPSDDGRQQYRLKVVDTGRERVAGEGELSGRITVEALAQDLYEAGNSTNVPWARRGRTVRDPWLKEALARLSKGTGDV